MPDDVKCDECAEVLYSAGELAPAGTYKQVDGHHQVVLEQEGVLPAGMDGHATLYVGVHNLWAQIHADSPDEQASR